MEFWPTLNGRWVDSISRSRMQKIITWVVIGAVVVVGGYFAVTYKPTPSKTDTATTPTSSGKKMAFSEFLKRNENSKCTVTQSISGLETKGTIFTYNSMLRGEFKTEAYGKTIQTDFILRDGYTYTWTSAAPTMGFKVKVAVPQGTNLSPASGQIGFNAETVGDYDCQPWIPDQSKFILPIGVSFKEMTAGQ